MIPLTHITSLTRQQRQEIHALVSLCKEAEPLSLSAPYEDGLDYFLLYQENSGLLLGFAFLFFPQEDTCECSVFIHPDYRKKGLCSSILNQVLDYVEKYEKKRNCQVDFCFLTDPATPSAKAVLESLEAEYWYSEYKMVRTLKEKDRLYVPSLDIRETEPGIYTASLDGLIIGSCAVLPSETLLPSGKEFYLYAFQIKESHQGQGYGKDFLLGMLALLAPMGSQVSVQVSGQNYIARNLYKKTGFQTADTLSYYLY